MNRTTKFVLTYILMGSLTFGNTKGLKLIKSETFGNNEKIEKNQDTTRIYFPQGALWVIKDEEKESKKLDISLPDKLETEQGILSPVNVSVSSNYGLLIKRYELYIYDSKNLKVPLDILKGKNLSNDMSIEWKSSKKFYSGEQLLFKLRVYDKNNNWDETSLALVDILENTEDLQITENTTNEGRLKIENILIDREMGIIKGQGLDGIESISIDSSNYSVDSRGEIEVKEYFPLGKTILPIKIIYKNGKEENRQLTVDLKNNYYFGTGMADFYLGKNYISGNSEVLNVKNPYGAQEYNNNIYNEGRITYFGKGRYGNKLYFKGAIDTKSNSTNQLFKNILQGNKEDIFERVEDEDFDTYPTYGDRSYIKKEVNTKGKIYLDVNYKKSKGYWGNYKEKISEKKFIDYNRNLYGAQGTYKSQKLTSRGEERVKIQGFGSQLDTLYSHEKFLGTGGSLYFLKNRDILNESLVAKIAIIDKNSGLIKETKELEKGRDYSLDGYSGRIILNKPLGPISNKSSEEIIEDNPGGKYYNYLIVDYQYYPESGLDLKNTTKGGQGELWATDNIKFGGTYIEDEKDGKSYEVKGTDITYRYGEDSYLKGEYEESIGANGGKSYISEDGGLKFRNISYDEKSQRGRAYSLEGNLDLKDINPKKFTYDGNYIKTWYNHKDKGYSFSENLQNESLEAYGFSGRIALREKIALRSGYSREERRNIENKISNFQEKETLGIDYLFNRKILGQMDIGRVEEETSQRNIGTGYLVGGKLKYKENEDNDYYLGLQGTLDKTGDYEENNMFILGGNKKIGDKITLNGEGSTGNRGDYLTLGGQYDFTSDYSLYGGYTLGSENSSQKVTMGQRFRYSDKINLFQEGNILSENGKTGIMNTYGGSYTIDENYSLGISMDIGKVQLEQGGSSKRKGITISSLWEDSKRTLKNTFQFVRETGEEKVKQFLTTNGFNWILSREYTLGGKINYSLTNGDKKITFLQSNIGLAYRPVFNDKFNFLSRYTYIIDKNPNKNTDKKIHVLEEENIYSLNRNIDIGVKGAYRIEKNSTTENELYLIGIEGDYKIYENWEIYTQYHWLEDIKTHDLKEGAIVGLYKDINSNFRMGGGYNFSGFKDSIGTSDYSANGWFINAIGKI